MKRCGAQTRAGSPCRLPAGDGGHCRHHRQSAAQPSPVPGPGEDGKALFSGVLDADERQFWKEADNSPAAAVAEQIRLAAIRQRRLLVQIRELENEPESREHRLRLEEALTRVQSLTLRCIESGHRLMVAAGLTDSPLDRLARAIGAVRADSND